MLVIKMEESVEFDEEFLEILSRIESMNAEKKKMLFAYLLERLSAEDIWDIVGASISEMVEKKYGDDKND
jgi:hypothetical protein